MASGPTHTETEWVKLPLNTHLTFVGKNVVCMGSGCHLLFHSLATGQHHVYSACGRTNGDGVQCYTGHRYFPVLAFAEKCIDPRIIIITCPEFQQLRILEDGAPEGYLSLSFSDHEYLISLSNLPKYEISIWNWRTQEKLLSRLSGICHPIQYIRCSFHHPVSFAQIQPYSQNVVLWDIHNCYKRCMLYRHTIKMPRIVTIVDFLWNPDGQFYALDIKGRIFLLNSDYLLEMVIPSPEMGEEIPRFCWFKGGVLIAEPNLDIFHFKRVGKWVENFKVCPMHVRQILSSATKDHVVAWSMKGELLELDLTKNTWICHAQYLSDVRDFCLVYPDFEHFVTLSSNNELFVWESFTGAQAGYVNMDREVSCITSNPDYPYVAVGTARGAVTLVSIAEPNEPIIFNHFNLCHEPITKIIFNQKGNVIVAGNMKYGMFFIIHGVPGGRMRIVSWLDYQRHAVDICIIEEEKNYKLYILVQKEGSRGYSDRIVIKTIAKVGNKIRKKNYSTGKSIYKRLFLVDGIFYAKPYQTRNVVTLNFVKKNTKMTNDFMTGHQLRFIHLDANNYHIYTCGYDGLVIVRSKDFKQVLAVLMPHHRTDAGVRKVLVDPFLRFVISLGEDNILVGSMIKSTRPDQRKIREYAKKFTETKALFTGYSDTQEPIDDEEIVTFCDIEKTKLLAQETKDNAEERNKIMEEFAQIKDEVVTMLEANLNGPELEKIDILDFYLHTKLKEYKEEMTVKECEWTRKYYKELIKAQDLVWAWMKQEFWDPVVIKRTIIHGIQANFSVENYTSPIESLMDWSKSDDEQLHHVEMMREFEEMLREGDSFQPWVPMSDSSIQLHLDKPPFITIKDENARIMEALEEEEDSDTTLAQTVAYPPSTIENFIEPCKYRYDQQEIQTYGQIKFHRVMFEKEEKILTDFFNKKFDDVMQQKVREMNIIIEKNNRLRYILSELKNTDIMIDDPTWEGKEKPETIITVDKKEIGITPYISPSEQALLDWQAAEAERIRLLLLADDFRERALIKMMDGVLEVRWEDTLKRDIPKPKCMLEKAPETFNEDDLRAVKDYEDKVAFLNSERQRYKNMLEAEYAKVSDTVKEGIKKFNQKLRDLLLMKIRVETARLQECYRVNNMQLFARERIKMNHSEKKILEDIEKNEIDMQWVQLKIQEVTDGYNECKNAYEVLQAKEKSLEKNFKKDFQDVSALIQEQSTKLYKKHPKMQIKGINTVSVLNELGMCCVTGERSSILTQECLDYLRSVDNLDQYVGVPNTIDENMYKLICKHRRLKLENELRVRGNTIEQTEIETAIQVYQKILTTKRDLAAKLVTDLAQIRADKLTYIHNKRLQISIKQGLVEVAMSGRRHDFDQAILVSRKEVEDINAIILNAGSRKIKVVKEKMLHRRQIMIKEWEHKKMNMQIEDLRNYLLMIQNVKVTKEIQEFLKRKAKNEPVDKGLLTVEQEVEITKRSYEQMIDDRQKGIRELDGQIKEFKKKNKLLDYQIAEINVDVCEQQVARDLEFEKQDKETMKQRMTAIVMRNKLVKQIQEQHNDILVLQTELELLRLKTYPTLKFKQLC